ncbi:Hypothetical protein HPV225_0691 [Helicobacter pylori v225d]|nr:Hypothetical protein HPV225_0691 [Helicobacter pylori v225d]
MQLKFWLRVSHSLKTLYFKITLIRNIKKFLFFSQSFL